VTFGGIHVAPATVTQTNLPQTASTSNKDAIPPQIPLWQNNGKTRGNERERVEDRRNVHKKNKHNHQMMLDEEKTMESKEEPMQKTQK
jgi:hypothetical protein